MPDEIRLAYFNKERTGGFGGKGDAKVSEKECIMFRKFLEAGCHWKDSWKSSLTRIEKLGMPSDLDLDMKSMKSIYATWCKNEEIQFRIEYKKHQAHSRSEFISLLEDDMSIKGFRRLSDVAKVLGKDPKWNALRSQRERQEIFHAYLRKNSAIMENMVHRRRLRSITSLKREMMNCEWLSSRSFWRNSLRKFRHYRTFKTCIKVDRLEAFKDMVRMLDSRERENGELENGCIESSTRQQREEGKIFLDRLFKDGFAYCQMRWFEVILLIWQEGVLRNFSKGNESSRPKEGFNGLLETLEDFYLQDKEIMVRLMEKMNLRISMKETVNTFKKRFLNLLMYNAHKEFGHSVSSIRKSVGLCLYKLVQGMAFDTIRYCLNEIYYDCKVKILFEF